ncbi:Zn-dependent hydrolase [Pseudomaricurvus alkylphenolicus]|nr:Zn-dependent hydrolase [Pseudomaricurvus alkylphenolicus]
MSVNEQYRVNGERLWSRLMAMGKVGATAKGGCNRQALTDADRDGRELFMQWCTEAGCELRIDAIGNIFARRRGRNNDLPPVITGSHLDTQPTGGKYDGIYGVLAGLEVIEALNDANVQTEHPIEAVVWTNEEGCRFNVAMMGSAVWSGKMPLQDAYDLTDSAGKTVLQELERTGFRGTTAATHTPVKAAFEAHIEQGPVLEVEGKTIGVVTGVQHMSRHEIHIDGVEAHAGPTPMAMRRDPMMAVADFLPKLYSLAEQQGPQSRMTFGVIEASPASNNTVPGHLMMTVDIRHPDHHCYHTLVEETYRLVQQACDRLQLPCNLHCFWEAPGVEFDPDCVNAVRRAVKTGGYEHMEMVSGAGHDACNLADVVPTSMIFIPCEGGLSHNEAEATTSEQATAGANVLLQAMLESAAN